MRFFEILLFGLVALACLRIIIRLQGSRWLDLLLLLALSLTVLLHLVGEGERWQMLPAYLLACAAGAACLYRASQPGKGLPVWTGWAGLALVILFALPPVLFPVPQLPRPDGPYAIGTQTFYWVDETRPDPFGSGPRRLMVQVWYPAAAGQPCLRAPYLDRLEIGGPVIAKKFNFPSFALSHINLATTHCCTDAAPADLGNEKAPVLIFSHGWTGVRVQNTFQVEELASRGYVVFAPDHTYAAGFTTFPDGSVALNLPSILPKDVSDQEYDRSARILGQTYVADLRFVMNQAARLASGEIPSRLAGLLDLGREGIFGHSTGGGAAVETCAVDSRCKAGLSMDAWLVPYDRQVPVQGLTQPFLFMQSQAWRALRNPPLQDALYDHSRGPAYRVRIAGTAHYDFSDLPLLTPLAPLIGLKGPLPTDQVMHIVNSYTLAFFDQALRGIPSPILLPGAAPFTDAILETHLK